MRDSAPAQLRAVKYGVAEAEAEAERFIDEMRGRGPWIQMGVTAAFYSLRMEILASLALRSIVCVKDDGFQEEREWRQLAVGEPENPAKIRQIGALSDDLTDN
jgi:hypothetical protein